MSRNRAAKKGLVFGVGVIGAYLTHALAEAGNEVTVHTREDRAWMLNETGLRIWHHLQKIETVDPKDKLQSWNKLRGQMLTWEALHQKYGN